MSFDSQEEYDDFWTNSVSSDPDWGAGDYIVTATGSSCVQGDLLGNGTGDGFSVTLGTRTPAIGTGWWYGSSWGRGIERDGQRLESSQFVTVAIETAGTVGTVTAVLARFEPLLDSLAPLQTNNEQHYRELPPRSEAPFFVESQPLAHGYVAQLTVHLQSAHASEMALGVSSQARVITGEWHECWVARRGAGLPEQELTFLRVTERIQDAQGNPLVPELDQNGVPLPGTGPQVVCIERVVFSIPENGKYATTSTVTTLSGTPLITSPPPTGNNGNGGGNESDGSIFLRPNEIGVKVSLLPIEVVELSPKVRDEDNNEIAGSEKPNSGKPLTPFVEVDPNANKIAHRELKVLIGSALKDKKVTWTLEALPGATPATIRGEWDDSPTHKDRFEASTAYGANAFRKVSQSSGETTVGADGHTAIRVNVPPIGFNQVRIKIQIEGSATPINLIDMEVPGVVVIDPGHGGNDSGAVGRTDNTVLEKDLALAYSLNLRQELIDKFKDEDHGLRILMTRKTTGEFLELADRARKGRDNGADVLVSIHFNSAGSASARGTETFVERTAAEASAGNPGDNKNVDEDLALATALNTTTLNAVAASDAGALNRGVKREGKAVTRDGATYNGNTQDYHPVKACLLEVEFLSHETALESVKLSNATGTAIKSAFSENAANDIFTNIRDQQ